MRALPPVPMARRAGSYAPGRFRWGPVVRPIGRLPIQLYTQTLSNVPLNGGQAQGIIPGSGTLTLSVGPQGIGTTWYPASVTISTTSGINDTSTCNIYVGPAATVIPATLQATLYPGGFGTASLAIPSLQVGQYVVAVWTSAKHNDVAAINVTGMMSALSP